MGGFPCWRGLMVTRRLFVVSLSLQGQTSFLLRVEMTLSEYETATLASVIGSSILVQKLGVLFRLPLLKFGT